MKITIQKGPGRTKRQVNQTSIVKITQDRMKNKDSFVPIWFAGDSQRIWFAGDSQRGSRALPAKSLQVVSVLKDLKINKSPNIFIRSWRIISCFCSSCLCQIVPGRNWRGSSTTMASEMDLFNLKTFFEQKYTKVPDLRISYTLWLIVMMFLCRKCTYTFYCFRVIGKTFGITCNSTQHHYSGSEHYSFDTICCLKANIPVAQTNCNLSCDKEQV